MDSDRLKEEKERLISELNKMCPKTESEQKLEIVKLYHQYNDIKDAVQTLMGGLANIENVTVKEIHERFNLSGED